MAQRKSQLPDFWAKLIWMIPFSGDSLAALGVAALAANAVQEAAQEAASSVAASSVAAIEAANLTAATVARNEAAMRQWKPPPAYDCSVGFENWEQLWTPDWKAWCCQNEQKGCPSTSTPAMATTGTPTLTVTQRNSTTLPRVASTQSRAITTIAKNPCDKHCVVKDLNATCRARIYRASTHEAKDATSPCVVAVGLVSSECGDVCSDCTLETYGCGVLQRLEMQKADLRHNPAWVHTTGVLALIGFFALLLLGSVAIRVRRSSRPVYSRALHTNDDDFLADDA